MRRVAIFGVGLIGGSFALALRQAGFDGEITGVSSPATIEAAMQLGVIDHGVDTRQAVATADLIYLSQPIHGILRTIAEIGPELRPETLVTDAGSTKQQIAYAAASHIRQALFVGGHPMAGKERAGVQAAEASLFRNRPYVLCPLAPEDLAQARFQLFREWITRIGARPVVLDASEHDRVVAYTSHVPQLLSTALGAVLAGVDGAGSVAGPAVQDLTRLGLSPFGIWRDILETNQEHIAAGLTVLIDKLNRISDLLGSDRLEAEFEQAAAGALKVRSQP